MTRLTQPKQGPEEVVPLNVGWTLAEPVTVRSLYVCLPETRLNDIGEEKTLISSWGGKSNTTNRDLSSPTDPRLC